MNTNKILKGMLSFAIAALMVIPLHAQTEKTYNEIEETQDEIETMYMQIYNLMEDYPEATYTYEYDDGEVTGVVVENITNANDKSQLELYLMDLEDMKRDIFNMTNRVGVYYVAETEASPKQGYENFYQGLRARVEYPAAAEELGVEGTIFVKFIVNNEGEISALVASEDMDTDSDWVVESMEKEAKNAVKATSGNWNPATVAGIPVSQWVVVPVQFKLDSPYYRPLFGSIE